MGIVIKDGDEIDPRVRKWDQRKRRYVESAVWNKETGEKALLPPIDAKRYMPPMVQAATPEPPAASESA